MKLFNAILVLVVSCDATSNIRRHRHAKSGKIKTGYRPPLTLTLTTDEYGQVAHSDVSS